MPPILEYWTPFALLAGACGAGYVLLYRAIQRFNEKLDNERNVLVREIHIIDTKVQNRPTFQEINESFQRKETAAIMFKSIEHKLDTMSASIQKFVDGKNK